MNASRVNLTNLVKQRRLLNIRQKLLLDEKRLLAQLHKPGDSEFHVAVKIKSILHILRRIMEDPEPPNVLFKNIRGRINGLQILKKGVPNRPRSTSGTPRLHTNNRQQNALHS